MIALRCAGLKTLPRRQQTPQLDSGSRGGRRCHADGNGRDDRHDGQCAHHGSRLSPVIGLRTRVFGPGPEWAVETGNRTPANLHTDTGFNGMDPKALSGAAVGPKNATG